MEPRSCRGQYPWQGVSSLVFSGDVCLISELIFQLMRDPGDPFPSMVGSSLW